jgi:predicted esterase
MNGKTRLKRKIVSVALSLAMLLAPAAPAFAANDIAGHWAEDTLTEWVSLGLLGGYGDDSYRPNGSITRAEFIRLVNTVKNYTDASGDVTPYADVQPGAWYFGEIAIALSAAGGYINGTSATTMSPDAPITREQAIAIISRLQGLDEGADISVLARVADGDGISDWAEAPVAAAINAGYVTGNAGRVNPVAAVTRAEAVVLLDRVRTDSRVFGFAGTYGPASGTMTVGGSVTIAAPGVTLQNTVVEKDVMIAPSVGKGAVTVSNATVHGKTYIEGGASVNIANTRVGDGLIVRNGAVDNVRVVVSGASDLGGIDLQSGATVVTEGLAAGAKIDAVISAEYSAGAAFSFVGDFDDITNNGKNAEIRVEGSVNKLTLNESARVGGEGRIATAEVSVAAGKGTSFETAPGVITGDGKADVTLPQGAPAAPVSGGSSGGGSSVNAFDSARSAALKAIEDAKLPDAAAFAAAGKTVVIPGQEIVSPPEYENPIFGQQGKDAVIDPNKIPYTEWPTVGTPTITSEYGNKASAGIFALIDDMLARAPAGYDIDGDAQFSNFLAFAELYKPAAAAGTPVDVKRVYVASNTGDDMLDQNSDPDNDYESSQPYRIYTKAIEVGVGPIEALRVLSSIPASSPFSLGPRTYESIGALVYDMGVNGEGVVVSYDRVPTDLATSYGTAADGALRVGLFATEVFDIAPGAKAYYVVPGSAGFPPFVPATPGSVDPNPIEVSALTADWNDRIRVALNDKNEIVEAYVTKDDENTPGSAPANYDTIEKLEFVYGVSADDSAYGYDGKENPFPVDYILYDPLKDASNAGANSDAAKYPLFIFFHGIGGGANKETPLGGDGGVGLRYTQSDYQALFETDTQGVSGAYVMMPRANEHASHDLSTQGWLHGYREDTNSAHGGEPTQVAAVIADIKQLVAARNVDPDRIYVTGFSAGGYMAWHTLFEGKDLFAAASPQGAAFFPEGSQLRTDYAENDLGLQDKLLAVKDIPIWLIHARNDGTCAWDITIGDKYKSTPSAINGTEALWDTVRSLSDGFSDMQGNALTRVTVHNDLKAGTGASMGPGGQHSPQLMMFNNTYTGVTFGETTLDYYDKVYGMAGGYNEASPTADDRASLYSYGINPNYSTTTPYGGTFIDWLNECGRAKAGD